MTTPSTDWREQIEDGEPAQLEALAEKRRAIQRRRGATGKLGRALHYKGHLGAEATFEVGADLPPHARQGVFAAPRRYAAYVRFSNGTGHEQPDAKGDVRGIAIKLLEVDGPKIIPGLEQERTQDFLLIQSSATPFRNATEFVSLVEAASGSPLLLVPRFASAVGFGRALSIVKKFAGGLGPFKTFAGVRFYSALPIQFGPYAVRYALTPLGDAPSAGSYPSLAEDLAARLKEGPLAWEFGVQFFVDEQRTPIEDASVDWPEELTPYVPVARLEVPAQDVSSSRGRKLHEAIEAMSFDPWHALAAHKPLGNMMRARSHAYRLSTLERKAAPEPRAPLSL